MTRVVSLLLVQLLTHFHFGTGFYFELSDKSQVQRCFIEDVDDSATFRGTYKVKDYHKDKQDSEPGAVFIRVIDPNGQDMLQRQYKDKGSFAFLGSVEGSYEICFLKVPSELEVTSRVYLHYELVHQQQQTEEPDTEEKDPEEKDPKEAGVENDEMKENNTRADSEIVEMLDKVESMYDTIWKMYLRFKKREKHFRELSKTTNSRIIWWAIFQVIVLLLTAAWQMRHLTKFFILKKIV